MTIIQAKPQARIYPTKLSPNLLIVQDSQTIQSVIDSCPVAAGSYTLIFIVTCNEVLPDGTPYEFYVKMTVTIT